MKVAQREFYKNYSWASIKLGGMCSAASQLFSIIYSYHESGKPCFISLNGFAKIIQCSRSTVQKGLNVLKISNAVIVAPCNFTDSLQYDINTDVVNQWKKDWENQTEKEAKPKPEPKQEPKSKQSTIDIYEEILNAGGDAPF